MTKEQIKELRKFNLKTYEPGNYYYLIWVKFDRPNFGQRPIRVLCNRYVTPGGKNEFTEFYDAEYFEKTGQLIFQTRVEYLESSVWDGKSFVVKTEEEARDIWNLLLIQELERKQKSLFNYEKRIMKNLL